MKEELSKVEIVWRSCNRNRRILADLFAQKGSQVTHEDFTGSEFVYPDTELKKLDELLASARKIAAQYAEGYKDKWPASKGRVLACARSVVDLGGEAAKKNTTSITINQPSLRVEKLTPEDADARILGYLLYALENEMVSPHELLFLVDKDIPYWSGLLHHNPDLAREGIAAVMVHYPDDPLHAQVKNARLKAAGNTGNDLNEEKDPVVEIASKALYFATKTKEYLKSMDYSPRLALRFLIVFAKQIDISWFSTQFNLNPESASPPQVVETPAEQSFLEVKSLSPEEMKILFDVYSSLSAIFIDQIPKNDPLRELMAQIFPPNKKPITST